MLKIKDIELSKDKCFSYEELKSLSDEYFCWCFLERTRLSFDWWFEQLMKQQDERSRENRDME